MKNDPTGTWQRDPRHMYCNPNNPTICLALMLFTYLFVTPSSTDIYLFPDTSQYNWYNNYLKNLLESKREYMMKRYGVNIDELVALSARKWASTYIISGYVGRFMEQAVNI